MDTLWDGSNMRRKITTLLFIVSAAYSAWRGIRLAFFSVASASTASPGDTTSPAIPAIFGQGVVVLLAVVLFYTVLGYTLSNNHYLIYRLLIGIHVLLTVLTLPSVGMLFLPSSIVLVVAALCTIGLPVSSQQPRNRNKNLV